MLANTSEFQTWKENAKRDDWYTLFVGSDIRQLIGEVERLTNRINELDEQDIDSISGTADDQGNFAKPPPTHHKESGLRWLVWVHHVQPWSVPSYTAQLVIDTEQFNYVATQLQNQQDWKIKQKIVLAPEDYELTLDQLIAKYPQPTQEMKS